MREVIRINKKFVAFMFLSLTANHIKYSETSIDPKKDPIKQTPIDHSNDNSAQYESSKSYNSSICNNHTKCSELPIDCMDCKYDLTHKTNGTQCNYGQLKTTECSTTKYKIQCINDTTGLLQSSFTRNFTCRSCFLSDPWEYDCDPYKNCSSGLSHAVECRMKPQIICIGNRKFYKKVPCNWTRGAKFYTALILSITLGGFGVDRFYLGHWQEGIGKLFSFGGLGVWVIVDSILISIGYLGMEDGSLLI